MGIKLGQRVVASNLAKGQLTLHRNCIVLIVLQLLHFLGLWRSMWLTRMSQAWKR